LPGRATGCRSRFRRRLPGRERNHRPRCRRPARGTTPQIACRGSGVGGGLKTPPGCHPTTPRTLPGRPCRSSSRRRCSHPPGNRTRRRTRRAGRAPGGLVQDLPGAAGWLGRCAGGREFGIGGELPSGRRGASGREQRMLGYALQMGRHGRRRGGERTSLDGSPARDQRPSCWRRRQRSSSRPISPDPACLPAGRSFAARRFSPKPRAAAGGRPVLLPIMRR